MDPYLENPALWPDVHNRLIVALADTLGPLLAPRYYISLQERLQMIHPADYPLVGVPDLTVVAHQPSTSPSNLPLAEVDVIELDFSRERISENYLEIFSAETRQVVTVVEMLSPINKQGSQGRKEYEEKREAVLNSRVLLHALYDRARFDLQIDYSQPPVPPLNDDDAAWARDLIDAAKKTD